jgi:hypothetical protein
MSDETEAAVAMEHRLTNFESGQTQINSTLGQLVVAVGLQNGRIGKLEDEEIKDRAVRDVRRRDLAAVGVAASIVPAIIAGVALFT